ncbi:hypothetical protein MTO96_043795 [Rhipicephalus appendiculatus]
MAAGAAGVRPEGKSTLGAAKDVSDVLKLVRVGHHVGGAVAGHLPIGGRGASRDTPVSFAVLMLMRRRRGRCTARVARVGARRDFCRRRGNVPAVVISDPPEHRSKLGSPRAEASPRHCSGHAGFRGGITEAALTVTRRYEERLRTVYARSNSAAECASKLFRQSGIKNTR